MSETGRRRVAVCPSCGLVTVLLYIGVQEGYEEIPDVSLWNCSACGSTVTGALFLPAVEEFALVMRVEA